MYTAALEGRLELLPMLFTRIREERVTISGIPLLVDLGRSCAPDAWVCDVTEGRGMLVAMDAMGYDAFHIGPQDMLYTRPMEVEQLRGIMLTQLAAGPWRSVVSRKDHTFVFANALDVRALTKPPDMIIALRLSETPRVEASGDVMARKLFFDAGWTESEPLLGRLDMVLMQASPYIEIIDQRRLSLPADLLPDPTISGVIEFVESEARYAQRKRGQRDQSG
jgi:hypothetical protein